MGKLRSYSSSSPPSTAATTLSLKFSFLFALMSITLFYFRPSFQSYIDRIRSFEAKEVTLKFTDTDARSDDNVRIEEATSRSNYIVRFLEYKRAEEHRIYLEENIRLSGWEWIERSNPAASFPTDFGLVSIVDSVRKQLVEEFGKLELVKNVSVDRSYSRSLFVKEWDRGGAFVDGKKRPGKIFTSMSFGEGDYNTPVSNSTISWKRNS